MLHMDMGGAAMRLFGRKEKIERTEKEGRREKKTRRTRNLEKESIPEQDSLTGICLTAVMQTNIGNSIIL